MTVQAINSLDANKVRIICPSCKSGKELIFPRTIINNALQLTTVSIPKGLICTHPFQAFIDKNFKVRGYQKVDFEFADATKEQMSSKNINRVETKSDEELINSLVLKGNYLECRPKFNQKKEIEKENILRIPHKENMVPQNKTEANIRRKILTAKEIYEEFWELIEDTNEEFKDFIIKDEERRKNLKNSDFSYFALQKKLESKNPL